MNLVVLKVMYDFEIIIIYLFFGLIEILIGECVFCVIRVFLEFLLSLVIFIFL